MVIFRYSIQLAMIYTCFDPGFDIYFLVITIPRLDEWDYPISTSIGKFIIYQANLYNNIAFMRMPYHKHHGVLCFR